MATDGACTHDAARHVDSRHLVGLNFTCANEPQRQVIARTVGNDFPLTAQNLTLQLRRAHVFHDNLSVIGQSYLKSLQRGQIHNAQDAFSAIFGLAQRRGIDGNSRQVACTFIFVGHLNAQLTLAGQAEHEMVGHILCAGKYRKTCRVGIATVIHIDVVDECQSGEITHTDLMAHLLSTCQ